MRKTLFFNRKHACLERGFAPILFLPSGRPDGASLLKIHIFALFLGEYLAVGALGAAVVYDDNA